MKLYGSYTSPYVRHCRIALLETGLDCDFIEIDAVRSAELSPTQRVPYFEDDDLKLSDSSTIIKYFREKSDSTFLPGIEDYNLFSLTNALLDSTINLFFLQRDGMVPEEGNYLTRQKGRIQSGLQELNEWPILGGSNHEAPFLDGQLRLACFLDWALFRERISLQEFPILLGYLDAVRAYPVFSETKPPA